MPKKFAGEILKQINDELAKRANNALKKDGLTFSQAGVILTLGEKQKEGMSIKELSRSICVAQPTMTGIIDRLQEKGIVQSSSDRSDKRIRMVTLTEKGIRCLKNADENKRMAETQFFEGLTEEERDQLITLLEKVRNNLVK